jgi:alpha-tubulin suppressor-like RCC1 family protein
VAYCWGWGEHGQLGNGSSESSSTPVAVSGGLTFSVLSANLAHTCGITGSRTAYCWGFNFYGHLGDGSTSSSTTPVGVTGGLTFTSIAAGRVHTCGLTGSGAAYCWGLNEDGQLGNGGPTNPFQPHPNPVAVVGGFSFSVLISGNHDAHTCAVTSSGSAYCWGWNDQGQLGKGSAGSSSTPAPVSGELSFRALSGGRGHTCGLTSAGAMYCWGWNRDGQLGNGSTTNSSVPVAVPGWPPP